MTEVPVADRKIARAVRRGASPADPVLRRAALRTAENASDRSDRLRPFSTLLAGGMFLVYAVLAIVDSSSWWFAAVFFAGLIAVPYIASH